MGDQHQGQHTAQRMRRTNFFFPEQMLARIRSAAKLLGLPMSEIMRRAIDEYLRRMRK